MININDKYIIEKIHMCNWRNKNSFIISSCHLSDISILEQDNDE